MPNRRKIKTHKNGIRYKSNSNQNTMKIKIKSETEVEVSFPYYGKNENGFIFIPAEGSDGIELYMPEKVLPGCYHPSDNEKSIAEYPFASNEGEFMAAAALFNQAIRDNYEIRLADLKQDMERSLKQYSERVLPLLQKEKVSEDL